MKRKASLLKLTSLFAVFSIGAALISQQIKKPVMLEADQHVENFDSYTYSGTYYNSVNFSASQGVEGNLRKALTSLIYPKGWYTYGSSGTDHLSTQLQYADEDPTNSSKMIYLYTRDSVTKNAASSWNREHVWPQSLSNGCWGESKAGTDVLHIRPTYSNTNSSRSNDIYADVNKVSPRTYNNMTFGYGSGEKFEPLDAVKGDVARTIMYIWTAYHDAYSNLPEITNVFESYDTLLKWHTQDKPDVLEGNRNNYSEQSVQQNRNPFVDHPELGWEIFGDKASASIKNACMTAYPVDGYTPGPIDDPIEDEESVTANITFGSGSGSTNINDTSISGNDSKNNTWTITTSGTTSFTPNSNYAQIGSSKNPASSINFAMSLNKSYKISSFSVVLGGFSGTAGSVSLKVGNTEVGTGSLNATSDVTVSNQVQTNGSSLSVSISNIAKGVKVYSISYTYEPISNPSTPTGITINKQEVSMEVGNTQQLVATLLPTGATGTIVWSSSNSGVASVSNGTVNAIAAGSAVITARYGSFTATCTVTVTAPVVINHGSAENPLTVAEAIANIELAGTTIETVYIKGIVSKIDSYNSTYHSITYWISDDGSTSNQFEVYSGKGLESANFSSVDDIELGSSVVICGDVKKYTPSSGNPIYEFNYNNYLISYESPKENPQGYLNSASSFAKLNANVETISELKEATITFAEENLENGVQYLDPFSIGEIASVTFAGGGNDGKYYTTGSGMRTYGGGTITVESADSDKITNIKFVWSDSTNLPTSNNVANTGSYNASTGVWSGSANTIVLTRPSGSGHWRLQSIEITIGGEFSIDSVNIKFGASISKTNWGAIAAKFTISDYGIMLFKTNNPSNYSMTSVKDFYNNNESLSVIRKGSGDAPTLEGEDYVFFAKVNVKNVANYGVTFCAAPFIVIDDTYYFLEEKHYSVNTLAQYHLSTGGSELSTAALNVLAGN